jgi:hypothetical protein
VAWRMLSTNCKLLSPGQGLQPAVDRGSWAGDKSLPSMAEVINVVDFCFLKFKNRSCHQRGSQQVASCGYVGPRSRLTSLVGHTPARGLALPMLPNSVTRLRRQAKRFADVRGVHGHPPNIPSRDKILCKHLDVI